MEILVLLTSKGKTKNTAFVLSIDVGLTTTTFVCGVEVRYYQAKENTGWFLGVG